MIADDPGRFSGATALDRHRAGTLSTTGLTLAALGVVFGEIGTSPLYALQTAFSLDHNRLQVTPVHVMGIISLVLWSITLMVSIKYVVFVMRADNEGEGGILALAALLRGMLDDRRRRSVVLLLGIVGAGLFYGDSLITPAISVMSAIEGLDAARPGLSVIVVPASIAILTILFAAQRFGTGAVGRFFGPVMLVWFSVVGALGVPQIIAHPGILRALSPTYAIAFWIADPAVAFVAMGAVVLTITGAEALYADMGHFGRRPIRRSWFGVVLVALALNYLGEGALILDNPAAISNPFFNLAPGWARVPLVGLATVATIIASQAVISGAFSVTNQAVRLGLLPNLSVRQTSKIERGQIYLPVINWLLFAGVFGLILGFKSSTALANAYGLAVTGTLVLTTTLFWLLARHSWRWPVWKQIVVVAPIAMLELLFLGANLTKLVKGGWLPVAVAIILIVIMTTWRTGSRFVIARRGEIEGSLSDFLGQIRVPSRVPGQAVYLHANPDTAPLALKENVRFNQALHERVFIVRVVTTNAPHVAAADKIALVPTHDAYPGIFDLVVRLGFNEDRNVPAAIELAAARLPELGIVPDKVRYFTSVLTLHPGGQSPMARWRKALFIWLAHNAASRSEAFHLPPSRTVVMGGTLYL